MSDTPTGCHRTPGRYEIRIQGHLDTRWVAWFDGPSRTDSRAPSRS